MGAIGQYVHLYGEDYFTDLEKSQYPAYHTYYKTFSKSLENRKKITDQWIKSLESSNIEQISNTLTFNMQLLKNFYQNPNANTKEQNEAMQTLMDSVAERLSGFITTDIAKAKLSKGIGYRAYNQKGTKKLEYAAIEAKMRETFNTQLSYINQMASSKDQKKLQRLAEKWTKEKWVSKLARDIGKLRYIGKSDKRDRLIRTQERIQAYQNQIDKLAANLQNSQDVQLIEEIKKSFEAMILLLTESSNAAMFAGEVGELLVEIMLNGIENTTIQMLSNATAKKVGNDDSLRGLNTKFFATNNMVPEKYSVKIGNFRAESKLKKKDLTDVSLTYENNDQEGISVKNRVQDTWKNKQREVNRIEFQHEGGFLQLIQNENISNFINHYMNLMLHADKLGYHADAVQASDEVKKIALIKIISGKNFYTGDGVKDASQIFVRIDPENFRVKVISMSTLINYFLTARSGGIHNIFTPLDVAKVADLLSQGNIYQNSLRAGTQGPSTANYIGAMRRVSLIVHQLDLIKLKTTITMDKLMDI